MVIAEILPRLFMIWCAEYPNVAFAHVETSRVKVNKLEGNPTFVAYKNRIPVEQVVGANKDKLQSMIATRLR